MRINTRMLSVYLLNFIVAFSAVLATSFLSIYLAQVGISLTDIGLIFAIAGIIAGIMRFPIGALVDSYGRKPLLLIGAIGYPVFAISLTMANTTNEFAFIKIMFDVFMALFWTAMFAYMYDLTKKRKAGRQLALRNFAYGLGAVIAPLTAGLVIAKYGFITLFNFSAVSGFIGILVVAFLIKKSSAPRAGPIQSSMDYKHILSISKYRYYIWIGVLHNIIWVVWYIYMPIYLKDVGLSSEMIGTILSFNLLIYTLTAYPIGKMIDRFPTKYLIIPGFFIAWAAGYWFISTKNYIQLAVSRALIGTGMVTTWAPMVARIGSLTPKSEHGLSIGLFQSINSIIVGLTAIIAGWLASKYGVLLVLKSVTILSLIVAIFLIFFRHKLEDFGLADLKKHYSPLLHNELGGGKI